MDNAFSREIGLLGNDGVEKLNNASVIVFGVGGVGSYVVEALSRSGIGNITIVDNDIVDETNLNRQLIALRSNIGMDKVEVSKKRILDINPNCKVTAIKEFYDENSAIDISSFDYIVDAIDSVKSKLFLIEKANEKNVKIISSMGTGNKICPELLEVTDISKTSYCPLAKKMRYELKKRKIYHLKCVYSKEEITVKNIPPSTVPFLPGVAGLLIAAEVIKDISDK